MLIGKPAASVRFALQDCLESCEGAATPSDITFADSIDCHLVKHTVYADCLASCSYSAHYITGNCQQLVNALRMHAKFL